jgi:hypothetical protein
MARFCLSFFALLPVISTTAVSAGEVADILRETGVQGGLVVHVECGDGKLTAALRANEAYVVHGLDADAANVGKAREHIRSLGLYGKVVVDRWGGKTLPYCDNLVNLLIAEDPSGILKGEIDRVLVPNGVAYVKKDGAWIKTVKPRPVAMDDWTHSLYDASGNAVSHDTVVGPPRHYQWSGDPKWSRHHDHLASVSAMVSAAGRIFYIVDEGSPALIQLPAKWSLVARDAFNGTILWKRRLESWHPHLWPMKSGPVQLSRRLVAIGDRVYVTLGLPSALSVLDAATGQTLRTYPSTKATGRWSSRRACSSRWSTKRRPASSLSNPPIEKGPWRKCTRTGIGGGAPTAERSWPFRWIRECCFGNNTTPSPRSHWPRMHTASSCTTDSGSFDWTARRASVCGNRSRWRCASG